MGSRLFFRGSFFAVGSIPAALAWLGVLASILLVMCLPPQLACLFGGSVISLMWLPVLPFEVLLALWPIVGGVAAPAPRQPA